MIYRCIFGTVHFLNRLAEQFRKSVHFSKLLVTPPSAHPALGQRRLAVDQRATFHPSAAVVRKTKRSRASPSLQVCESDESMICFAQEQW